MNIENYTFNMFNEYASNGISTSLSRICKRELHPIVVCVGSDLVLGDSLGPLVGTMLKKNGVSSYVYGTLNFPITAKEIEYTRSCLKQMHPNSTIIAVDAALSSSDDVGLIKVVNKGLKPGIGINKNLGEIGDVSVVGIVARKSSKNFDLFNLTRLNLVYKMAEVISLGIMDFIKSSSDNANDILNTAL